MTLYIKFMMGICLWLATDLPGVSEPCYRWDWKPLFTSKPRRKLTGIKDEKIRRSVFVCLHVTMILQYSPIAVNQYAARTAYVDKAIVTIDHVSSGDSRNCHLGAGREAIAKGAGRWVSVSGLNFNVPLDNSPGSWPVYFTVGLSEFLRVGGGASYRPCLAPTLHIKACIRHVFSMLLIELIHANQNP